VIDESQAMHEDVARENWPDERRVNPCRFYVACDNRAFLSRTGNRDTRNARERASEFGDCFEAFVTRVRLNIEFPPLKLTFIPPSRRLQSSL